MQTTPSIFRIILLVFFGLMLVAGVVSFSFYRGGSQPADAVGDVSIWGTFEKEAFELYLYEALDANDALEGVQYRAFSESTFHQDVLEAMASGQTPDLLFIKDVDLYRYLDKVYTITAESYSRSLFEDNFVDGASVYLQNGGVVGIPLASDPLVMLWNRDMFASAGLARPPEKWGDFFEIIESLSIVDETLTIKQSALAFGGTDNVDHLKAILATLFLQVGNAITATDSRGEFEAVLAENNNTTDAVHTALRFYTEFSDASKRVYSWNRSMPSAEDVFLAGRLAVYFAPISTIEALRLKNPNLNFAVAEIPSLDQEVSRRKSVYAPVYGFVIPRTSANVGGAFQAAVLLTENDPMRSFSQNNQLAPVRRDLVIEPSNETYREIINRESLYSQSFIDPSPKESGDVFKRMVEYITSGQRSIERALVQAHVELNNLLDR